MREETISLGEFIRTKRLYLGLTQELLAERIHVSKSAVAKWEINGGIPDRDNMYRLAQALHVTVNDLHHVIDESVRGTREMDINITSEVIGILESYGYKVVRPGEAEHKQEEKHD